MAKRFFSGLGSGYIALILNALMMIILMPFFLNHLGEEMMGIYIMIAGLTNMLNLGIGWLSEASSLTLSSRSHAHKKHYLVAPIYNMQQLIFGFYGIAIMLLLWLAAFLLPYFWHPLHADYMQQVQISLLLFSAHYVVFLLHNGDLSFLTSQLRLDLANACRAIYNIIFCALTIALLYLHPSLYVVFIAQIVTTVLLGAASQIYLRRYHLSWLKVKLPRRQVWRAVLVRIGGPIAAIAGLWGIMLYADTALVGFLLGPIAAAHYFAGAKIADLLALILIRISETASPYFARLHKPSEKQALDLFYLEFQRLLIYLCIIAAAGYAFFGEAVMNLWLGSNAPALPSSMFIWIGLMILVRTMVKYEYNVMIALQLAAKIVRTSIIETLVRIVSMIVCIKLFGMIGVAISFVLSYVLGIYWLIKYKSVHAVKISWMENIRKLILPILCGASVIFIWDIIAQFVWSANSHGGTVSLCIGMMVFGALAAAIPLAIWRKAPLFDYKALFSILERMAATPAR